jgi:hypothetical protein
MVAPATVAAGLSLWSKYSTSLAPWLAQNLMMGISIMTNRLATIANAQKKTRARDLVFACFVALAAVISVTTVSTAASNASSIAMK